MAFLSVLGTKVIQAFLNRFESIPSSSVYLKGLKEIKMNSFRILVKFTSEKTSGSALLLVGMFLITDSIFLLVIFLFRSSVSSLFNLARLHISRNYSTSRLSSLLIYNCLYSLMIIYTYVMSIVTSPLLFLILFESVLFFPLVSLAKNLSICFIFFYK